MNNLIPSRITADLISRREKIYLQSLTDYENLLRLSNEFTIDSYCILLEKFVEDNSEWYKHICANLTTLDFNHFGCLQYFLLDGKKLVDLSSTNFFNFNKEDLLNVLKLLANVETFNFVDKQTITSLAKRVESSLDKDATNYRLFRVLCIVSYLGIFNTSSCLSNMILLSHY